MCCKRCKYNKSSLNGQQWREAVYYKTNNPYKVGHCWHCGFYYHLIKVILHSTGILTIIPAYKDIENQCCIGVSDPLDINNLVPSCIECNVGHRFEKKYKCY